MLRKGVVVKFYNMSPRTLVLPLVLKNNHFLCNCRIFWNFIVYNNPYAYSDTGADYLIDITFFKCSTAINVFYKMFIVLEKHLTTVNLGRTKHLLSNPNVVVKDVGFISQNHSKK